MGPAALKLFKWDEVMASGVVKHRGTKIKEDDTQKRIWNRKQLQQPIATPSLMGEIRTTLQELGRDTFSTSYFLPTGNTSSLEFGNQSARRKSHIYQPIRWGCECVSRRSFRCHPGGEQSKPAVPWARTQNSSSRILKLQALVMLAAHDAASSQAKPWKHCPDPHRLCVGLVGLPAMTQLLTPHRLLTWTQEAPLMELNLVRHHMTPELTRWPQGSSDSKRGFWFHLVCTWRQHMTINADLRKSHNSVDKCSKSELLN